MNLPKPASTSWQSRAIALFIAVALSVTWYYNVKVWAVGVPGNATNFVTFYAGSKTANHMDTLGVWRARIGGLWITGKLFDSVVVNGEINMDDYKAGKILPLKADRQEGERVWGTYVYKEAYQNVFGLYHACWLFLFFVVLIIFLQNPLLVMFGTLAGMFYTLTPAAVYYSYAWDMPAIFFFTLGYFLWRQKQYNWILAVIFVGCPFKETTAVIAILYFFTDMPMKKRVIYFAGAAAMTLLQKIVIMEAYYHSMTVLTQNLHSAPEDAQGLAATTLGQNLKEFFSLKWNHFIFVNAGTLLISFCLPAHNKVQWGTKALLVVFFVCQALAGSFNEFRIMLEALPIALIYIAEYLNPASALMAETVSPLKPQPKKR
jgi:hypothetical protein